MGNEQRVCKWCSQSLEGSHGNVLVHAKCRKDYDKWMRPQSKQKEHSIYKNKLRYDFRNHCLKHTFIVTDSINIANQRILEGYTEYGYNAIYHHLRWYYKNQGIKISMPNNFIPLYTDLVMALCDDIPEDFFHTNKRKNS